MANQPKKYKKFVATAATATLVASAIVPVASAASLSDIAGNTHEEAINALVDAKVISGYPDGTFKPNKTLTRSDVVKLLGKYLETEGYAPAADYATSPAFNDLKAGSNDELLKYASIVKEAGVFAGSNGNLLAGDKITRENMAVTLVRMINTLKDVSLEEYVAAQDFKGDVKDLNVAKAEARTAIAVLDFYDITNPSVSNFNPKGDTTRGQFATFLHKTINADFAGASATTGTVKAINNTTVEVTFGKEIDDIKALKFAIEGLEVKDAVVKQTDKKTAVITTASQEAGKAYTVTEGGKTIGKFTGISAVIPKSVTFTKYEEASKQGVIGKEVTLKATVAVEEGQSKAGIPVTFNIISSNTANAKKEVEVKTDENGVASYTYTQYYAGTDEVVAYATSKSSIFANAKVYWANDIQLKVTELTPGAELANDSRKDYKVNGERNTTYYVIFKETQGITPDKINYDIKVTTAGTTAIPSATTTNPYELVTGVVNVAKVKTNNAGEGTFTVFGSNGSVTPVVYQSTDGEKYSALDLQAVAPKVTFAAVNNLEVAIKAEGVQAAAKAKDVNIQGYLYDAINVGGREYTVTVRNKNGTLAPEGTTVQVNLNASKDTAFFAQYGGTFETLTADNTIKTLTVGKNGEVKFRVAGTTDRSYVLPTVFDDKNKDGKIGTGEVKAEGEVTYFTAANVVSAKLFAKDTLKRNVTSVDAKEQVTFTYQSVDQNGFAYTPSRTVTSNVVTSWKPVFNADGVVVNFEPVYTQVQTETFSYTLVFSVFSDFSDITIDKGLTTEQLISKDVNKTITKSVDPTTGTASFTVDATSPTKVTVSVSGVNNIFPVQPATVEFVNAKQLPNIHRDNVTASAINTVKNEFKFNNYNAVPLSGENIVYLDATSTEAVSIDARTFINKIIGNASANVTRTVKDGVTTFTINSVVPNTLSEGDRDLAAAYTAANNATQGKTAADFTEASWKALEDAKAVVPTDEAGKIAKAAAIQAAVTALAASPKAILEEATAKADAALKGKTAADFTEASWKALEDAKALPETTDAEKTAKAVAIDTAVKGLKALEVNEAITITSATYTENASLAGVALYDVKGTIATTEGIVSIKVSAIEGSEVDPSSFNATTGEFTFAKNSVVTEQLKIIGTKADGSTVTYTVVVTKK